MSLTFCLLPFCSSLSVRSLLPVEWPSSKYVLLFSPSIIGKWESELNNERCGGVWVWFFHDVCTGNILRLLLRTNNTLYIYKFLLRGTRPELNSSPTIKKIWFCSSYFLEWIRSRCKSICPPNPPPKCYVAPVVVALLRIGSLSGISSLAPPFVIIYFITFLFFFGWTLLLLAKTKD